MLGIGASVGTFACGDSGAEGDGGASGSQGAAQGAGGGASSGTGGGQSSGATGVGGAASGSTGSSAASGSTAGGSASTASGSTASGSVGGTGSGTASGSGGAPQGGDAIICSDGNAGAMAMPEDFSMNNDTGGMDPHVLVVDRGGLIRRVTHYVTSGQADHQHEFEFTNAELELLLDGYSVVVSTEGPPLDAASGHTHTVTVRPCV